MAAALNVREVGQREPLFNLKSISNNSPGDQNFALSLSRPDGIRTGQSG